LTLSNWFGNLFRVREVWVSMARWVAALRLTGVGFFIGGSIVLGVFTGIWIDNKLDMVPVFTLLGLVFGIIIAGFGVYQMLIPLLKNRQDKENG